MPAHLSEGVRIRFVHPDWHLGIWRVIRYQTPPIYTRSLNPCIVPLSSSRSVVTKKVMSTPFQGASGPSGLAGLRPTLGQPSVSGNNVASESALISLQQIPPEQSVSRELRRLIVRLLVCAFDFRAKKLLGGSSILWKLY